jgi:hypothetical protein
MVERESSDDIVTPSDWQRITWRLGIACCVIWGILVVEIVKELMK